MHHGLTHRSVIFDQGIDEGEQGKIIQYHLMPEGERHRSVHEMGKISGRPSTFFNILQSQLQEALLPEDATTSNNSDTYYQPITIPTKDGPVPRDNTVYISAQLLETLQTVMSENMKNKETQAGPRDWVYLADAHKHQSKNPNQSQD